MGKLLRTPRDTWQATNGTPAVQRSLFEDAVDDAPPDWRERQQALDITQSWVVEAPAGSGKTGLLIQRFLKLLGMGSVAQPEEVLAITFTRAATEELRERVLAELEDARQGTTFAGAFATETRHLAMEVLAQDQRLQWSLVENPRRLNIRTIDSVCGEITNSLPLLSGGAARTIANDPAVLYREAAHRTVLRLGSGEAPIDASLRDLLLHRDGNVAELEALLASLLASREQWFGVLPGAGKPLADSDLEQHVRPRLDRALEEVVRAELEALRKLFPEHLLQQLSHAAATMSALPGYADGPSPMRACEDRWSPPAADAADLEHWRALLHLLVTKDGRWRTNLGSNILRFHLRPPDKEILRDIVASLGGHPRLLERIQRFPKLPPACFPSDQWIVGKALFHVLRQAVADLGDIFESRGECDFAEVAIRAREALAGAGAAKLRTGPGGGSLQHLLVDEVQDTSSSQYQILSLLTQGWDGTQQTAFLVGDPKQSIYMFRQARVESFLQMLQTGLLGQLPLGVIRLTANFRSQAGLVRQFNDDFSQIFAAEDAGLPSVPAISFGAAQPVRASSETSEGRRWHLHLNPGGGADDESSDPDESSEWGPALAWQHLSRHQHARTIREIILRWRSRPLPPGRSKLWKIAVLVRARQHLREVVTALRGRPGEPAIPFRAVKVEALGERMEVQDLLSLTRALLHPADRVAWFATLRAPWCGLELWELYRLSGSEDPHLNRLPLDVLLDRHAGLLPEASRIRLDRVRQLLRTAAGRLTELPLAELVERTWRSLGGDAALDEGEMQHAAQFFGLLSQLEEQTGSVDLELLRRNAAKLFAETPAEEGAVDLMTIHEAKGLEWDVVFVPQMERLTSANTHDLLTWEELPGLPPDAAPVMLAPIRRRGDVSEPLGEYLRSLAREREAAERKRLFYVASTRAREELHLFASPERSAGGEVAPKSGSLLSAAWSAVPVEKLTLVQEAISPAPRVIESLAASEEAEPAAAVTEIQRLPADFNPAIRLASCTDTLVAPPPPPPAALQSIDLQPGSLRSRSAGTAAHALLELASERVAKGHAPEELLKDLPGWKDRAAALLRAGGVASRELPGAVAEVLLAVRNTLTDAVGQWLLRDHPSAQTEWSAISWRKSRDAIRVDRLFVAGPQPRSTGDSCLWLVDYKTASLRPGSGSPRELAEFLAAERRHYEPQLQRYAQATSGYGGTASTRVALFYPLLREFVWWDPFPEPDSPPVDQAAYPAVPL